MKDAGLIYNVAITTSKCIKHHDSLKYAGLIIIYNGAITTLKYIRPKYLDSIQYAGLICTMTQLPVQIVSNILILYTGIISDNIYNGSRIS